MFHSFWSLIFCVLAATQAAAKTNLTLSDIPSCSLQCLVKGFELSGCGLLDTKCQCASTILSDTTSACVLDGCSKSDGIVLSHYQAQLCGKKEQSRQGELLGFIYGGLAFSFGSFVIRMASRWVVHKKLFLDDYMVLGAMGLTFGLTGTSSLLVLSGFGKHIFQVEISKVSEILFLVWFSEGMYVLFLVLIKLALVLFFLRIFPQRWFKSSCYTLLFAIISLGLMWILLLIFQCRPIRENWDIYTTELHCINVQAVAYAGAGINIAQDLAIMILPIPLLLKVRVGTSRKLALLSMFSVGIFVIATSCARLGSIKTFANSADATWDDVSITVWTTLEIDIALFCCNMPSISALISHLRQKSKEAKQSNGGSTGYGGSTAPLVPTTNNSLLKTTEKKETRKFSFPVLKRTTNTPFTSQDDMTLDLVKDSSNPSHQASMSVTDPSPPPANYLSVAVSYHLSWSLYDAQKIVKIPYDGGSMNTVTVVSSERDLESGMRSPNRFTGHMR